MEAGILEKIKLLPPDKQVEGNDFVGYLLSKYKTEGDITAIAEKRRSNAGRLRGQIWMADDFNETPGDFKNYS